MITVTATLEEDPLTGETLLPIPPELLEKLEWTEGDILIVSIIDKETFSIRKK